MAADLTEKALIEARAIVTRAKAHASSARAMYNKNKKSFDAVDGAQALAQISIAESLAGAFDLLLTALEEE